VEPKFDPEAELEIGSGAGHGGSHVWIRFRPVKAGVDVLHIRLRGWGERESPPVVVTSARMKSEAYVALLHDLATASAAKLKPVERDGITFSSADFWVQARLTVDVMMVCDWEWAGYDGSAAEIKYAKPQAAVTLARGAVKDLDFKPHSLTDADRKWASEMFARDWARFEGEDFHWWVRERSIFLIGVVGDAAALPTLGRILDGSPKDRSVAGAGYAVRRLLVKNPRAKDLEETDAEREGREIRWFLGVFP
jgi:hypothetical protein